MAPEDEGLAEQKDGEKKRASAPDNAADKRARVGPPEGLIRIANEGGGNCLFHAIAKAIEEEGKSRTHLQLRAMCVSPYAATFGHICWILGWQRAHQRGCTND